MRFYGMLSLVGLFASATPIEANHANATFTLGSGAARPGGIVRIPLLLRAATHVIDFSFSIDFDEESLQLLSADQVFQRPDGQPWDIWVLNFDNNNDEAGNTVSTEGWVEGGGVFGTSSQMNWALATIPANKETEVVAFYFAVKQDAKALSAAINFVDGVGGSRWNGNAVTSADDAHNTVPQTESATVLVGAVLRLLRDKEFIRGDSNDNGTVDLSDAVTTLDSLFVSRKPLVCEDAADANDDGVLDISDAIRILQLLFLGGPPLSAPTDSAGEDPTQDSLGCIG